MENDLFDRVLQALNKELVEALVEDETPEQVARVIEQVETLSDYLADYGREIANGE
jgi:hypothetical protein